MKKKLPIRHNYMKVLHRTALGSCAHCITLGRVQTIRRVAVRQRLPLARSEAFQLKRPSSSGPLCKPVWQKIEDLDLRGVRHIHASEALLQDLDRSFHASLLDLKKRKENCCALLSTTVCLPIALLFLSPGPDGLAALQCQRPS